MTHKKIKYIVTAHHQLDKINIGKFKKSYRTNFNQFSPSFFKSNIHGTIELQYTTLL